MKKRAFKIIDLTTGQHSPLILSSISDMRQFITDNINGVENKVPFNPSEHGIMHIADVDTIEQPDGVDEDAALEFNVNFIPFCTAAGFLKLTENHAND